MVNPVIVHVEAHTGVETGQPSSATSSTAGTAEPHILENRRLTVSGRRASCGGLATLAIPIRYSANVATNGPSLDEQGG